MNWLERLIAPFRAKPAPERAATPPPAPGGHCDRYAAWLAARARADEAELAPVLLAIASACDDAEAAGEITAATAKVLLDGASHRSTLIWSNTVEMMQSLERFDPRVGELYSDLARAPSASARFAAICCLGPATPDMLIEQILTGGLVDKSTQVRWKAAQTASQFGLRGLIPEMTAALARESNDKAKRSIAFSLGLLRDGHLLDRDDDGGLNLTAPMPDGGIASTGVTQAQIDARGIAALVDDLRNERL